MPSGAAGAVGLYARGTAAVVALEGLAVLLGWALHSAALRGVFPGLVAMNPATAVAFVLAGLSLWLLAPGPVTGWRQPVAMASALLVALVALAKLASFAGWDLGVDQLLFRRELDAMAPSNRMAPNTALDFLLCAAALLALDRETLGGHRLAQWLAMLAAIPALFAVIGYAYGVTYLYGLPAYIPMALNTAVAFCLLTTGILCARPGAGPIRAFTRDSSGGALLRRLLPAVLVIPAALGWLNVEGQRAGLYESAFGASVIILATVLLLTALTCWVASSLDHLDQRRRQAEEERQRQYRAAEHARSVQRAVLDAVDEGIILLSPRRRVLSVNRRFTELFGLAPEALVGHRLEEVAPEIGRVFADPAATVQRLADTAADPQREFSAPVAQRWPEHRQLELYSSPVVGPEGEHLGRQYALRDVTLQREVERLKEERRRQLEEELAQAARVQSGLLPSEVPVLSGFELAGRCLPAREVGGDFFDWHAPAPDELTLTLGDVMGKGMPAALLMATVRASLDAVARQAPPATAVEAVATALERDLERSGSFVTLFHARANAGTRCLEFVDAGHGHAFLRRADGRVERLEPRGLPLGILGGQSYEEGSTTLRPGDALVVYSDGVLDAYPGAATPADVAERLDGAASAGEILERLLALAPRQGALPDDFTVVVLRCREE